VPTGTKIKRSLRSSKFSTIPLIASKNLIRFSGSIGENLSGKKDAFNFLNNFPGNYHEDLRKPFKKWAAKSLPGMYYGFLMMVETHLYSFISRKRRG